MRLRAWLRMLFSPPTCDDVTHLIAERPFRELTPDETATLSAHLGKCGECWELSGRVADGLEAAIESMRQEDDVPHGGLVAGASRGLELFPRDIVIKAYGAEVVAEAEKKFPRRV